MGKGKSSVVYVPQRQLRTLENLMEPGKVVLILGARRTGKTTLLNHFLAGVNEPYLSVSGDDLIIQEYLSSGSIEKLRAFVGDRRLLAIDEAQRIRDIGLNLKLMVDSVEGLRIVATGSSSFDLASQVGEPLTGRKFTLRLYPLAQMEIGTMEDAAQTAARLESRLVYGSYPEVVLAQDNSRREAYLKEIISSYLYKDILELDGVRHAAKLARLLQLLAFQVGREVSCTELGTSLGMSKNTVERYLDLLEKSFVLVHMTGFSRNLRKEITKNQRWYFLDTGVRNALINNFNPLSLRDDAGMLWENYLILERLKNQEYTRRSANTYFWRTYSRQEIDLVEEREGNLFGYEITWGKGRKRPPTEWTAAYPGASWEVIDRENYLSFIA
jgi:predicted AAA+ superfamily ATPase